MDIIISNTGGQPIYEQICRQVKGAIAAGKLKPGEPLPSIRALARDLRISVITTKRAYEELERDGFICTQAGKGSFVAAQDAELARESNLREIEEHLQAAVELSRQIELPAEELQHILQVLIEEE
ncbi:MAG: GntR family transcriptional regulator [Oscillospiraceae bacterium]|jgi:GntR family transcriptional regulator|nr:GntR family transcriptional regulator [Oscillospiraceae bacterium]MCI8757599.1 GntR family transcriptional regulator [Oscillospiraceae bacterium]MCI9563647.1 GntR family transcriptional regulator [Oscillospiraceae bacterium]